MKLIRVLLLLVAAAACVVLLISSAKMIENAINDTFEYESLAGDFAAYFIKKNATAKTTNYDLLSGVSRWQVIALVVNLVLIAGLLVFGLAEKCIPALWIVTLLVSLLQINYLGQSKLHLFLSFVPAAGILLFKILGGNRRKKKEK